MDASPPGKETMSRSVCKSCGARFLGPYCSQCGEKQITREDYTAKHFLAQLANQLLYLDSRLFQSFWMLARRPGSLTQAYLEGRRRRYLKPVQVFLIANIIYFFMEPLTVARTFNTSLQSQLHKQVHSPVAQFLYAKKRLTTPEAQQNYEHRYNAVSQQYAKSLIFLLIPICAGLLALLLRRSHRYFFEHLIFATHFFAFALLYVYSLGMWLLTVFARLSPQDSLLQRLVYREGSLAAIILLALNIYVFFGLRHVYGQSRLQSLLKAAVFTFGQFPVYFIYRFILFVVTYYTV